MKNNLIFNIGIILLLVLYPLFAPGYMFSLDQAFTIDGWIPKVGDNIFWIGYLAKLFSFFSIPTWVLEKIIIFGGFSLLGIGGYLLTKKWKNYEASSFAILLLIFNPFLYGRFLDGQINIYISYFLYPIFFYFLHQSFSIGGRKNIAIISILSFVLCLTSLHNAVFLFFIGFIFGIIYFIFEKKYKNILFSGIFIGLINLLWFIPLLFFNTKKGVLFSQVSKFGESAFSAFATDSGIINLYFNVLSLHGYWGERMHRFINTWEYNLFWIPIFLVILFLVVFGIYKNIKSKNPLGISLFILCSLSYIFSLGIAENNIFSAINKFLYDYFPFYSGFREPQKWSMFLVISYAYFGSYGVYKLQEVKFFQKINKKNVLIFIIGIFPIAYTFGLFNGFSGQVTVKNYPQEWYEVKKNYIEYNTDQCKYFFKMKRCYNTLVLPWHGYMNFQFIDNKVTLISVTSFFGENLLQSDNVEIADIYSFSNRFESKVIERYIRNIEKLDLSEAQEFITELKYMGIDSILFFKEADYKKYLSLLDLLENKNIIKKIENKKGLILYRIK